MLEILKKSEIIGNAQWWCLCRERELMCQIHNLLPELERIGDIKPGAGNEGEIRGEVETKSKVCDRVEGSRD